jgi:hypothetical protein
MDSNAPSVMTSDHLATPPSSHSAVVANQSFISGDNSGNLNSFNNYDRCTFTASGEDKELLSWLSSLQPWQKHQDVRSSRVQGTGEWLLQMDKFKAWYNGAVDSALCCYGGPGAGKTFIRYGEFHTNISIADCRPS